MTIEQLKVALESEDRAQVKAVIEVLGHKAYFRAIVSKKGNGTMQTYVYAGLNWRQRRYLGKLRDLAQLSNEQLRAFIAYLLSETAQANSEREE